MAIIWTRLASLSPATYDPQFSQELVCCVDKVGHVCYGTSQCKYQVVIARRVRLIELADLAVVCDLAELLLFLLKESYR